MGIRPTLSSKVRTRRRRRAHVVAIRSHARPRPIGFAVGEWVTAWWLWERKHFDRWRMVFLVVMVLAGLLAMFVSPAPLVLWIGSGAICRVLAAWADVALDRRRVAFAQADTPTVAGWRLMPSYVDADPELVELIDLTAFLHAEARIVWRPVRGQPKSKRVTYSIGLRDLARRWASSRGEPQRRGDRLARRLLELGVIREVHVWRATCWRLTQPTADEAIRLIESITQVKAVDWSRRDPDYTPRRARA